MAALPVQSAEIEGPLHSKLVWTLNVGMWPESGPKRTTYRYIERNTLPDLSDSINAAAKEGFRVVPGSLSAFNSVYMEKSESTTSGGVSQ
jgi:hypothetical protein